MSYNIPVSTKYKEYYVSVDSRDRNRNIWAKSSQFEVRLEPTSSYVGATIHRAFKNVVSIEIIDVIFPNQNYVLDEMYLLLYISELDGNIEVSSGSINKPIAKLVPTKLIGNHVLCQFDNIESRPKKIFYQPFARLDKMTFELRKYDNTLFDFGTDTESPTAPDNNLQVSITLKITITEPTI